MLPYEHKLHAFTAHFISLSTRKERDNSLAKIKLPAINLIEKFIEISEEATSPTWTFIQFIHKKWLAKNAALSETE